MDLGTIGGLVAGAALIIIAMAGSGSPLGQFFDPGSILMVIGGSFGALLIANPLSRVLGIMKYINKITRVPNYGEEKIITTLVNFSEKARREGLLALEDDLEEVEQEFLRKGIQFVVDGTDPEIIKTMLFNELNQQQERHDAGIGLFSTWGSLAPAFGMIGTLAGLIGMLANLDDPDAIGSGMALALITTFYGSIFANLVLIPISKKLQDRDKDETLVNEIMIEGILSIQSGDNPRILESKLISFLPPARREAVMAELTSD